MVQADAKQRVVTVCVVDEERLITGVDNWVHDTTPDFQIIFITNRAADMINSMYFPTNLVYVTVAGKNPGPRMEEIIGYCRGRGAKVIVLAEYEINSIRQRATAAGAIGFIGTDRSYRMILQQSRTVLWGAQYADWRQQGAKQTVVTPTWEEREVLRLVRTGHGLLLVAGHMNLPYERVQNLLVEAKRKYALQPF